VPLTDVGIAAIGEPKRGDIVTFFSPRGGTRLVKRIVGLPGDTALRVTETIGGSRRRIQYLPDASPMESFGPLVVPADSYFMLGDNRDNSADSRYIGPVARRLLIGRVNRLVASADIVGDWMPRIERFGKPLD
jgi:signal peptidase I